MKNPNPTPQEEQNEKELAAMSYVWIFSVAILLAKRDNAFIQHHARRGFALFLFSVLFWVFPFLHYAEFLVLALCLYGFITAASGNENLLPVISEIADGTLQMKHLKYYWHQAKHGAIRLAKKDHVTPAIRHELDEETKEIRIQEGALESEKRIEGMEEKRLSSLYHRLNEDEKKLDEVKDEVHHLEEEVKEIKNK